MNSSSASRFDAAGVNGVRAAAANSPNAHDLPPVQRRRRHDHGNRVEHAPGKNPAPRNHSSATNPARIRTATGTTRLPRSVCSGIRIPRTDMPESACPLIVSRFGQNRTPRPAGPPGCPKDRPSTICWLRIRHGSECTEDSPEIAHRVRSSTATLSVSWLSPKGLKSNEPEGRHVVCSRYVFCFRHLALTAVCARRLEPSRRCRRAARWPLRSSV